MAKLTLLALAFAALVAFATAHTTIVTTVVEDENPFGRQSQMCRQQLQQQRLDICQRYLQQGQSPYDDELNRQQGQQYLQQQCCQQLQNVDRQCQCEAVKQVFEISRQQIQGQQQGQFGSPRQLEQQLEQKAQNLPQQCRLQIHQQECQIRNDIRGSQQCRRVQQQSFNQCQRFIQQAQQEMSGSPRVMMFSGQSQQLEKQLQQCCNELENVQRDCQCEALEEVYKQAVQQQQGSQWQQGGRHQQPWQQGGQQQQPWKQQQQPWQQQQQPWQQGGRQQQQQQVGRVIETIRNQCNLQVQQCRIPSSMF